MATDLDIYYHRLKNNKKAQMNRSFVAGALIQDVKDSIVILREGRLPCYKVTLAVPNSKTGKYDYVPVEIPGFDNLNLNNLKEGVVISVGGRYRNAPKDQQKDPNFPNSFVLAQNMMVGGNYCKEITGRNEETNNLILLEGDIFYNKNASLVEKMFTLKFESLNHEIRHAFRDLFPAYTEDKSIIHRVETLNEKNLEEGTPVSIRGHISNPLNTMDPSICIESLINRQKLKR